MSDTVLIVLVVAVAVVIVLWMFRSSLSRFKLRAREDGFEAELQTREEGTAVQKDGVSVSRNKLFGKNKIDVKGQDASVDDNLAVGENVIEVKQRKSGKRKKS